MNRTSVSSSNLKSVGYDAGSHILEIEFNHGGIYQYFDVPSTVYEALMSAASKGTYFDQNIKNGGYRYAKVG